MRQSARRPGGRSAGHREPFHPPTSAPVLRPPSAVTRFAAAGILLLGIGSAVSARAPAEEAVVGSTVSGPRVSRIEIDLTLDTERGLIHEIASLTVTGKGESSLTFAIHEGLSVERSTVSSGRIEHEKAGERVRVFFDPPLSGPRRITFTVTGRPKGGGGTLVGPQWAVLNPVDNWYPRFRNTWAETRVRVRAPESWVVVAPGEPVEKGTAGSWEWRSSKPVRSVGIAGAPGLVIDEGVAVRMTLRVASEDGAQRADAVGRIVSDPLAWFSGALAPYPFEGFNLVFIRGFNGRARSGGMMVVPADVAVQSRADGADLLAAQWFGELLAGDGNWMEAFAAWEATIYSRDRALPLPTEIARLRRAYFSLPSGRDTALLRAKADTPAAVVRGKGSAAPDMVRLVVGNRAFFLATRDLFASPGSAPMSLEELRSVFEKRAGHSLKRPFSEWFERAGAPEFEVKLRTFPASTGGFRADLSLVQKRGVYALPLEVVFHGPGKSHTEVVDVADENTSVFYILDFEPVRVELDPGDRIFRWTEKSPH